MTNKNTTGDREMRKQKSKRDFNDGDKVIVTSLIGKENAVIVGGCWDNLTDVWTYTVQFENGEYFNPVPAKAIA